MSVVGSILSAGASIFGHRNASRQYRAQARQVDEQMAIAREVSNFNKETLEKVYPETIASIKQQTKNLINRQMIAFASSGASPGSASPYFVMGNINRMGDKALQQAAFNHSVNMKNEEFRTKGMLNTLNSQKMSAKANASAEKFNMWGSVFSGASTLGTSLGNMKLGMTSSQATNYMNTVDMYRMGRGVY